MDEELADESDMEMETPSEERDDSEGSLADFIEHDSDEVEEEDASFHGDDDDMESESAEVSENEDDEDEDEEQEEEEEDPDRDVIGQYTADMETSMGLVVVDGVRRSMRSTRGKAPVRYVDEEYADLMLEGASHADLQLSDVSDEEEEEGSEAELEEDVESSSSSEEELPPPPPKKRARKAASKAPKV